MQAREGSGNAEEGGLFHDTRLVSPRTENQSNIPEGRISPEYRKEISYRRNPTDTDEKRGTTEQA